MRNREMLLDSTRVNESTQDGTHNGFSTVTV